MTTRWPYYLVGCGLLIAALFVLGKSLAWRLVTSGAHAQMQVVQLAPWDFEKTLLLYGFILLAEAAAIYGIAWRVFSQAAAIASVAIFVIGLVFGYGFYYVETKYLFFNTPGTPQQLIVSGESLLQLLCRNLLIVANLIVIPAMLYFYFRKRKISPAKPAG